MDRIHTYTSFPDPDSEITPLALDQIQDAMAPVSALTGFRVGGDVYNDGLGGNLVIAPNRMLMGTTGVDATVTLTDTGEPTLNTPNVWYYVYESAVGTVQSFEISTTAPDAALCFKFGDTSRRYVGCYRLDATGFLPYIKTGGEYRNRRSALALSRFTAATSVDTAGLWTTVSLVGFVPPHARIVHLTMSITAQNVPPGGTRGLPQIKVRTYGDTAGITAAVYGPMRDSVTITATGTVSVECDSIQRVQILVGESRH